tara:strand:- start:207 stop:398 length:192 start_codon:yes stop_codon:yes gene_type:complete
MSSNHLNYEQKEEFPQRLGECYYCGKGFTYRLHKSVEQVACFECSEKQVRANLEGLKRGMNDE